MSEPFSTRREEFLAQIMAEKDQRIAQLEAQVKEHAAFAFAAGQRAGEQQKRIAELESELATYGRSRDSWQLIATKGHGGSDDGGWE